MLPPTIRTGTSSTPAATSFMSLSSASLPGPAEPYERPTAYAN